MPSITLSDLKTKVYDRLDNNTGLYEAAEVTYVINEAIRIAALWTGFYRSTEQLPAYSVADRLVYSTPSGILAPTYILFEGRLLQKLSLVALARKRRNWATDRTDRHGRVEFWAPVGAGKFVITPRDHDGGRDMTITGVGTPPLLVDDDDVMALENEYIELIVEYCVHRLPLKEGGKIFADGSLALNNFYSKLNQRRKYESLKVPAYKLLRPREEAGQ